MEVLRLLQDKGLAHIEEEYSIKVRMEEHPETGVTLAALNYDQIESPKFEQVVRECRGLIVCPKSKTIVSRSFDRFFNYGEGGENEAFVLERSVIMEKVDGSLMKLYWHDGHWYVSTRGTCFATGPVGAFDITFEQLFWRAALGESGNKEDFLSHLHRNLTYVFELAAPENRVVTRYAEDQLVLLAARSPVTGYYKSVEYKERIVERLHADGFNVRLPKMFNAGSFDEVVKATKELGNLQEGFVAWDVVSDERIKFKSAAYVAVHHLRGEGALVPKRIATLVVENEHEEYLTYFDEDRRFFEPYIRAMELMLGEMDSAYSAAANLVSQKDFALAVKDFPFSAVLFNARKFDVGVEEAYQRLSDNQKVNLLMNVHDKYKELGVL